MHATTTHTNGTRRIASTSTALRPTAKAGLTLANSHTRHSRCRRLTPSVHPLRLSMGGGGRDWLQVGSQRKNTKGSHNGTHHRAGTGQRGEGRRNHQSTCKVTASVQRGQYGGCGTGVK